MKATTYESFLEEVRRRAGFEDLAEAARAAEATLPAIGGRLLEIDLEVLGDQLPSRAGELLRERRPGDEISLDELYGRVAEMEGVTIGFAAEHVQTVCRELALMLDDEGRRHLELRFPEYQYQTLFSVEPPVPRPDLVRAPIAVEPGRGTALSTGRPGSSHPLSEASEYAHRDSVLRANNPHGDRKLSSTNAVATPNPPPPVLGRSGEVGPAGEEE